MPEAFQKAPSFTAEKLSNF